MPLKSFISCFLFCYNFTCTRTVDISGYVSEKCHLIADDDKKPGEVVDVNNSTASIVVKSVPIYVHPEGIQHQTTDSAYFCANGNRICHPQDSRPIYTPCMPSYRATDRVDHVRLPVPAHNGAEKSRRHRVRGASKKVGPHLAEPRTQTERHDVPDSPGRFGQHHLMDRPRKTRLVVVIMVRVVILLQQWTTPKNKFE